jgi:hypothetical protein
MAEQNSSITVNVNVHYSLPLHQACCIVFYTGFTSAVLELPKSKNDFIDILYQYLAEYGDPASRPEITNLVIEGLDEFYQTVLSWDW